jgi:hypothetical protein
MTASRQGIQILSAQRKTMRTGGGEREKERERQRKRE